MTCRILCFLSLAVLSVLLRAHVLPAEDILVLRQEPSASELPKNNVPLLHWQATRNTPVQNVFSVIRIDLQHPDYEMVVMIGSDPDGDGPADAVLTDPSELMRRHQAIAAINANAFSRVMDADRFRDWYPGMPVNILGLATSRGVVQSTLESPKRSKTTVAFWVDDRSRGSIERPASGFTPADAVGDFYGYLLDEGKVTTWQAGQRHPRTALGIDRSKRYLYLVVVDGRQKGYSTGATMGELASFMKSLGCHQAINLDGGGSSIMLIHDHATGELMTANRPSSGEHRPVPVMLGIRVKQSPE